MKQAIQRWHAAALMGLMLLVPASVAAQDYPSKVIKIVATAPGTSADVSGRVIANALSKRVGQPVIVENIAGAVVAMNAAAKAAPDGYGLYLYGNAVWLAPYIYTDLPYDPLKVFTPVSMTTRAAFIFVVPPSLPAKSMAELIAMAKARPGDLNYGAGDIAGTPNTAAKLFNAMAGVNIVMVPYKSTEAALQDVIAGRIQLMVATTNAMQQVRAGKLRGLAVTTSGPSTLAPGLPTVAESVPGYEVVSHQMLFAPLKTPVAVLARLNREIVAILNDPEVKQRYFDLGFETVPSTPEEAMTKAQSERQRLGKIVQEQAAAGAN